LYFRKNNPRRFKDEKASIPLSTPLNYRKNRKECVQIGLENHAKFKDGTRSLCSVLVGHEQ
jgi:hypothetical protein